MNYIYITLYIILNYVLYSMVENFALADAVALAD